MAMPGQYSNYGPPGQGPGPGGYVEGGAGYPPNNGMQGGNFNAVSSLKQMNTVTNMNLVCFAAAVTIVVTAFITGASFLFSFQMVDWMMATYLMFFGCMLAFLDTPFFKTIKAVGDAKLFIWKFLRLATRVTGKGLVFLFTGCSLFVLMYDNYREQNVVVFFAVVSNLFVVGVGLTVMIIGLLKSHRLGKARQKLIETGAIDHRYDQWAQTYRGPQGGLTPSEFNSLTMENGGYKFEDHDLKAIFNALVSREPWRTSAAPNNASGRPMVDTEPKIPKEDLISWVKGGWVWL